MVAPQVVVHQLARKDANSKKSKSLKSFKLMKTKVLTLVTIAGIIALSLSFSFAPSKNAKKATKEMTSKNQDSEPIGGLVSEDKF
jgi:hypothetical protein